jgi:hypothetical protein
MLCMERLVLVILPGNIGRVPQRQESVCGTRSLLVGQCLWDTILIGWAVSVGRVPYWQDGVRWA